MFCLCCSIHGAGTVVLGVVLSAQMLSCAWVILGEDQQQDGTDQGPGMPSS